MKDDSGHDAYPKGNRRPVAAVRPYPKAEKHEGSHAEEFEDMHDHALNIAPGDVFSRVTSR